MTPRVQSAARGRKDRATAKLSSPARLTSRAGRLVPPARTKRQPQQLHSNHAQVSPDPRNASRGHWNKKSRRLRRTFLRVNRAVAFSYQGLQGPAKQALRDSGTVTMVFATSSSSFSSLRAPILRLAKLGTAYPIEAIVTFFCAATLVYFQLIKVSDTLSCPPIAARARLRGAGKTGLSRAFAGLRMYSLERRERDDHPRGDTGLALEEERSADPSFSPRRSSGTRTFCSTTTMFSLPSTRQTGIRPSPSPLPRDSGTRSRHQSRLRRKESSCG